MVLHDFWTFFIWSTVAGLAVIGIYQLFLLILRARGVFCDAYQIWPHDDF